MPKKPQYASHIENELYEAYYFSTYHYTGRKVDILPVSLQEAQARAKAFDIAEKAKDAGLLSKEVNRIIARAEFDALLDLAKEGYQQYRECFMIVEVDERTGERTYKSGIGDVPELMALDYDYTGTPIPKANALLHCYVHAPADAKELIVSAIQGLYWGFEIKLK